VEWLFLTSHLRLQNKVSDSQQLESVRASM
jgi:hypothetical protein